MISLNAVQTAIVASDYVEVSWLFDVFLGTSVYHWSTKSETLTVPDAGWDTGNQWDTGNEWDSDNDITYTFKINNFDGVTLDRNKLELGITTFDAVTFSIPNASNTLTASDFVDKQILLSLLVGDGTNEEIIQEWKMNITQCETGPQELFFTCESFIKPYLESDYPLTEYVADINPSTGISKDDGLCVPLPFGTCYIPLRSIYITDQRYYVLGLATHNYTIEKVSSPREWNSTSEWTAVNFSMTQSTQTINTVDWRVFQPIIADSDADGTPDACGLWKSGDYFLDIPTKFGRGDTKNITNPSAVIRFILEDLGATTEDIDLETFSTAGDVFKSRGIEFNGVFDKKQPADLVLSNLLNACHATLKVNKKIELHALSETSQVTATNATITRRPDKKSTFDYQPLTTVKYDSGFVAWQAADQVQDQFIKTAVAAKSATSYISSDTLSNPLVQDSQNVQKAASLYFQRKFLQKANISFVGKPSLMALQPDDFITVNHADYGGSNKVLIDSLTIQKDLSIKVKAVVFSDTMDSWSDLSPSAITLGTDDSSNVWKIIGSGPDSIVSGSYVENMVNDTLRLSSSGKLIVDGSFEIESAGTLDIKSGGAFSVESGGTLTVESGGDITISAGGDFTFASGGDFTVETDGELKLLSGGDMVFIGSDTDPGRTRYEGTSYHVEMGGNASGTVFDFVPLTDDAVSMNFGDGTILGVGLFFDHIDMKARDYINIRSQITDANQGYFWAQSAETYGTAVLGAYYDSVLNYVKLQHTATVDAFYPDPDKGLDFGLVDQAWDDAYADDWNNVADFYYFDDRDDLAAINQIKGSGIIEPHSGYEIIDDDTLPDWLLKRHKKNGDGYKIGEICRTRDGRPYLSLKTMISLCLGGLRALDAKKEDKK